MLKKIVAGVLVLVLLVIGTSIAVDSSKVSVNNSKALGSASASASVSSPMIRSANTSMNESSYRSFLDGIQSMYREDFNYSGNILEDFVNKSVSSRDALAATTSIYILTSQGVALLEINKPPTTYVDSYNNTLQALLNLRIFLWNMSKFYETGKNTYLTQARKNLNESVSYYKKGQEELALPKH